MDSKIIQRLKNLFDDILTFSEFQEDGFSVVRGISKDGRTILGLFQKDGVLTKGSLQLALPKEDDLEMIKMSCWAIIYLTCLFPDWGGIQTWITQTIPQEIVGKGRDIIQQDLPKYLLSCRHHREASVLDFQFQKK